MCGRFSDSTWFLRQATSVTTTVYGGTPGGPLASSAPFLMRVPGPFVPLLNVRQPLQQFIRPEPLPRQQLTDHTVHLGSGDLRHLFPAQILLKGQQESPSQQAHGDVMVPASPGAGLVLVQSNVALLSLELGFDVPSGAAHVGQGFQGACPSGALER